MIVLVTEQLTFSSYCKYCFLWGWENPDAFPFSLMYLHSRTPPYRVSSAAVPSILIKGLELPNPNTFYLIPPVFENDLVFVFVVPGIEPNRPSHM